MPFVGRPRKTMKDLPLGVYAVKGRYYAIPVNAEMRQIFARVFPGKRCAPLGADKAEARKLWVKLFVTDLSREDASSGTVGEIIRRYKSEIIHTLHPRTAQEHARYCARLLHNLGAWRYARSESEASTGPFLRSIHITRYLRDQAAAGRPVAGNKEVQCLSRMFRLAKTLWGYTEYNPCLQVEYNTEEPRGVYVTDEMFMAVYRKAPETLQCMMDIAQMTGARRGMILRLTLADITDEGLWFTPNKRKRSERVRRKLSPWTEDLRGVIDAAIAVRSHVRGGQKEVSDLSTAPLFLTRAGKAYSETAFNSLWQRARRAAGFTDAHALHFHDIKAKALSDSPSLEDAMRRGDHVEARTTRRVYERKPDRVVPLPRVSKKII